MIILKCKDKDLDNIMSECERVLKNRGVIAYPTESYYALGALATDEQAVKRLFELKRRPEDKPLPLIVGDEFVLRTIVRSVPDAAKELMNEFWPGPLTILFEAQDNVPEILTGKTGKVAVRIPGKSFALHMVKTLKLPVTSTSANISSQPPSETAEMVADYFGEKIDLIIDGGNAPGGKPSTIVDATASRVRVLREGSVLFNRHEISKR